MKNILIFFLFFFVASSFAQESLNVYRKVGKEVDESNPVGSLIHSDWIKEQPIPQDSVKKYRFEKDTVYVMKKGKQVLDKKGKPKFKIKKKKVFYWEKVESSEPPKFVPVSCKLGDLWAKRADLARFKQASQDLSGVYASSTGTVTLKKSPTNPRLFTVVIQNGPASGRAELEASNVEAREANGNIRMTYTEEDCTVDIAVVNRKVKVAQRGCGAYNVGSYALEGEYNTYKGNPRTVVSFNMPEQAFTYKKFKWCDSGFDSCKEEKDENGKVTITWSKGGNGFIERRAGDEVHTYRPFENVIPHKRDYYKGEKPQVIKTKRTDISGEWWIWYFYPKSERFKMVRSGMREDIAQMEIYE
ncbi:MAG: hypothetical protein MJY87_00540 [Fibrobacter sp.]|nr:hypothetical protein [Fibrobacter sp.]